MELLLNNNKEGFLEDNQLQLLNLLEAVDYLVRQNQLSLYRLEVVSLGKANKILLAVYWATLLVVVDCSGKQLKPLLNLEVSSEELD